MHSASATSSTRSSAATRSGCGVVRRARRGSDAEVEIVLDLVGAAFGTTAPIDVRLPAPCVRCDGSGCEPGTHPSRCDVCGGSGEVRQVRRSILGQIVTASPSAGLRRHRSANPLPVPRLPGRRARADRPDDRGAGPGRRRRLAASAAVRPGAATPRWAERRPVREHRVRPHPDFDRQGDDLVHVKRVSVAQAALGAVVAVPTLEEPHDLAVPPGTQPGEMFRVKGAGVPSLRGRGRGDLLVRVDVRAPVRRLDRRR